MNYTDYTWVLAAMQYVLNVHKVTPGILSKPVGVINNSYAPARILSKIALCIAHTVIEHTLSAQ